MEGHQDNIQPLDYNEYQPINPWWIETRVTFNFSLVSSLFECYEMESLNRMESKDNSASI